MGERVRFGWEKLETLLAEANTPDLIEHYWAELWPYQDIPLDVDWPRLLKFEADGIYRVWAARAGPTLVGFVSYYVQPHIFSKHTLIAMDGGHFLDPAFRDNSGFLKHAWIGWRMWRSVKAALRAEGVKMWCNHDNATRPLMPFFLALGMEPRSTWFWGYLDDGER